MKYILDFLKKLIQIKVIIFFKILNFSKLNLKLIIKINIKKIKEMKYNLEKPFKLIREKDNFSRNHKFYLNSKFKVNKENKQFWKNNDFSLYIQPELKLGIKYEKKEIKYSKKFYKVTLKLINYFLGYELYEIEEFMLFIFSNFYFNDYEICMLIYYILIYSKNNLMIEKDLKTKLNNNIIEENNDFNKKLHNKLLILWFLSSCSKVNLNSISKFNFNLKDLVLNEIIFKKEIIIFHGLINLEIKNFLYNLLNTIYDLVMNKKYLDFEIILLLKKSFN